MMVAEKPYEECNGLEMYVKEQIKNHETDFFPSGNALVIAEHKMIETN